MLEVHHAAGGAFSNFLLVGVEQIEHVARAAIAGLSSRRRLDRGGLRVAAGRERPGSRFAAAVSRLPDAVRSRARDARRGFAIALSFNHASAIGTGICRDCCERDRDELAHVLFDLQKRMFPDAQVMSGECGHA